MIGLVGAHRVGKSTLCKGILRAANGLIEEVPISISDMQSKLGFNSANQNYDWETRKRIQTGLLNLFIEILAKADTIYQNKINNSDVITERTPLDLVGYVLSNAPDEPTEEDREWINAYIVGCIKLTNIYYTKVIFVQPGIPYKHAFTSAGHDTIDKVNEALLSVIINPLLTTAVHLMPADILDHSQRVNYATDIFLY